MAYYKEQFLAAAYDLQLIAPPPFGDKEEDKNHRCVTLFYDNPKGESSKPKKKKKHAAMGNVYRKRII